MAKSFEEQIEKLENIVIKNYAYPDEYIKHGSVEELEEIYGMRD